MSPALQSVLDLIITYRYWVLLPLAFFEGPIVALFAGFLVSFGYFNFLLTYCILILGDFLPDIVYYFLGRYGNRRNLVAKYGKYFGVKKNTEEFMTHLWHNHAGKTMFLSKLAYGLSTPFLISAGLVRMPFKRFMRYAVPISIFQYGLLLFLGYHFGNSYQLLGSYVQYAELALAALAIALLAGYMFFFKYAKKNLVAPDAAQENDNQS